MVPSERLSRFLSFLLRHRQADYPLRFDKEGFVVWGELLSAVQDRFPEVAEKDIFDIIENSDKKRFELKEGKVRASYGHSFPVDLGLETIEPPAHLYHGTARDLAQSILREGLKPRGRQYVHLSRSVEEATEVGRRRDPSPSVVVVDCQAAHADGIPFYCSGPLFLAKEIPAKFLSLWGK
ncbi:MAG TPA: RNA 2'-phosphotransferase [Candidatus Binatia bacterium]|nr:RNA 2'-phosphotransferase [Candidatus Binatia bacterium]